MIILLCDRCGKRIIGGITTNELKEILETRKVGKLSFDIAESSINGSISKQMVNLNANLCLSCVKSLNKWWFETEMNEKVSL